MLDTQVLYMGRWVSRDHFCAFVYSKDDKKLAKSYQEFTDLINSRLWNVEKTAPIEDEQSNIVDIKPKRGRKCQSQPNQ